MIIREDIIVDDSFKQQKLIIVDFGLHDTVTCQQHYSVLLNPISIIVILSYSIISYIL